MLRLKRYTVIENITTCQIKIPKSNVSLIYKRKPDGHEYFTALAQTLEFSQLYISLEELLSICRYRKT